MATVLRGWTAGRDAVEANIATHVAARRPAMASTALTAIRPPSRAVSTGNLTNINADGASGSDGATGWADPC